MSANPNQQFVLELQDLQVLLNYLSKRPYEEVFKIVEVMQRARVLVVEPPAPVADPVVDESKNEQSPS